MSKVSAANPVLRVREVSKFYPQANTWALEKIDLEISAGERIAIMGPSGCGKSTLLNLMGALDRPTRGDIVYRSASIFHGIDLDEYRSRSIGFVFQSFYLLPSLTVLENVQIPTFELRYTNRQRVALARSALEKVGMLTKSNRRPSTLSGGERQRTAIARAIINAPEILLADEPTGNLDSRNAQGVLELFDELCTAHRLTLILVTHDTHVAHHAQRILRMMDGKVIGDERVDEMIQTTAASPR